MTASNINTSCTATSTEVAVPSPVSSNKKGVPDEEERHQANHQPGVSIGLPAYSNSTLVEGNPLDFVELLGRTNFSFLQGASHPEEMALQAQELGYRGLAICDLNGLYGVVRGFQAIEYPSNFLAQQDDLNRDFITFSGAEMQLADRSSIALIPLHKDGYTNLCQVITESKRNSEKGFSNLTLDCLELYSGDLLAIALPPWNEDSLYRLRQIYGDRLYLPVWKDYTWESLDLYKQALHWEHQGFEIFATNRPFMHARERKPLHDVLTCILHKTTLHEAKTRLAANGERHLKSLPELIKLWADRPDLLTKTVKIAARIQFSLKELRYEYPQAARPPGKEASEYLRELVYKGVHHRWPTGAPERVYPMIEHELGLISELRYEDYFLTLWDVCEFASQKGILHQGRGSAANSIVCYTLGLTAVDPTEVELLFERFISKERGEPPDIDIDFESGRREEVIQYIYEKYGAQHAAMVCTVICYRSRMALRECAKVLGIPLKRVDEIVKYMGREGIHRLEQSPEKAKEWKLDERTYKLMVQISLALIGFPRHLGIHTGGFLIAKRPITECVPVEKATMDKRYVIQWNKDDLNVLKMLKIDVLGLGMLTALQKCFELLEQHQGRKLNLYDIPSDDQPTYAMIQKADTVGTFQIESRAQMSLLPRLKPKNFYDLVIEVAIVRPGPIQGGMIHPFIRRRDGLEDVSYPHPDLKPILGKTCGVPIFQEQIMQIASTVAGFTPGEADELRRIMSSSWKKSDLMAGLRQRLINGMIHHGIEVTYAEQIYQTIVGFASYGFPESHAASFALLTYASCYLKCRYPDIFVTALLNAQPMGFYSPRSLIMDAQRHGVKFLPVDLQKSDYDYTLEKVPASFPKGGPPFGKEAGTFSVRVGFRSIYGLKEKHIDGLVEERKKGEFRDLSDLIRRTRIHKTTLMQLAAAGALECLGLTVREALWKIQALSLDAQSLFFGSGGLQDEELLPEENDWEKLNREYNSQGYSLVRHPLGILRPPLQRWSATAQKRQQTPFSTAAQIAHLKNGSKVRVAGLLSLQQRPPTAKGVAFLTLEDETGLINIVIMPDVYKECRLTLVYHPLLHVCGLLEKVQGVINIRAQVIKALPVEKLLSQTPKELPPTGFDFQKCVDDHTVG
ncbi:MAG: error-prone DNA polymerase [Bdellovibrionales bacterium]|nr:error-prone DNA polymerase [Bdellovibrionales bacterium]